MQTPHDFFWFETWIKALANDKTHIDAMEAGTVLAYDTTDLVMLDAEAKAVAITVM